MDPSADLPLVSVIITSYNYARFVPECIAGVLAQTYRNFEVVVVDDGSVDESVKALQQALASAEVPMQILTQANRGQAAALTAAFDASHGVIIAPLDSDDTWRPNKLARIVEFIGAYPDGGVYQHQLETSRGPKRAALISGDVFAVWKSWDGGKLNIADAFDGISFSPFVPTSGLAFRRDVMARSMPIPEEIRTCADAYLTRTCTAWGPLMSIPETLGSWRDHGDNAGLDDRNNFGNFWAPVILPALNRYYEEHGLGLVLEYEPKHRSHAPVARLFGESAELVDQPVSPRVQLDGGLSRRIRLLGEFAQTFLREKDADWLKNLVRGRGREE